MIVLTKQQRDFLIDFKAPYTEMLEARGIDFVPIPIKNDLYILPEELLTHSGFLEIMQALHSGDYLSKMVIREVKEDELIKSEI